MDIYCRSNSRIGTWISINRVIMNNNLKYIIPIAICSVLIIVLLFTNEWLAYQHCRIYKTYNQEISFLHKYPDSKYRKDVCELIKNHEKEYANEAFDKFATLSYTSDYLVKKYESSYSEYIALFPNGEMRQRVEAYISKAREENEFKNIKYNSQVDASRLSAFLANYPDSPHASEVRNIMATAQYRDNSLKNGAQPYAKYYGYNNSYGASSVEIKSSSNHDCVVTVKYNNANGNVAGHIYVRRGQQAVIKLP